MDDSYIARMKAAAGIDWLIDDPDDLPRFAAAVRKAALGEAVAVCLEFAKDAQVEDEFAGKELADRIRALAAKEPAP